ncbi:putative condensin-2 complex subunit D3 [Apostichopus japonicus]|uniref:Putative condensin-2 complex subunit D3 n=1 Tax=Stichopus japonicus TaxID=307972 RepID=A0A2G8JM62_STIJA|nr:putative condensin-2 complex subunit D3 [Apostichopus japonicus]
MVRPPRMKGSPARAGGVTPGSHRQFCSQGRYNPRPKSANITAPRRARREFTEASREGGVKDKNPFSFEESEQEDVKPNVQEIDALIERNRAISTPDKTIMDVTFQAAADLSVIPTDSPVIIPSSFPIRVYGKNDPRKAPGTKSWMPQLEKDQPKRRDNLILMLSPEHPAPKPRKWNVKVSESRNLRVSLTKLHIQGNDGEEADGGSYSKMDTRDNEMEGRLTRRSARLKKR